MRIGNMEVIFHRTVRVPDGRQPSNLPPNLGRMDLYPVAKYAKRCPENWEKEAYFLALHETEAMWMSFRSWTHPTAMLVGAGGINALTGEKLGITLEKENYLVAPPQRWLDGWKDKDGTVYQFVATAYQKGKGITVAEQLMGEESKTGAIGIAFFNPKDPSKPQPKRKPIEGHTPSIDGDEFKWLAGETLSFFSSAPVTASAPASAPRGAARHRLERVGASFDEMGIGRGGKIIQKIYPDPHGLEVWEHEPWATLACYLVNAEVFEEITGEKIPRPVSSEKYSGPWFGLQDKAEGDVTGTSKFTGLKSAVFPASTPQTNDAPEPEPVASKSAEPKTNAV
jgi:hypothetical protein